MSNETRTEQTLEINKSILMTSYAIDYLETIIFAFPPPSRHFSGSLKSMPLKLREIFDWAFRKKKDQTVRPLVSPFWNEFFVRNFHRQIDSESGLTPFPQISVKSVQSLANSDVIIFAIYARGVPPA